MFYRLFFTILTHQGGPEGLQCMLAKSGMLSFLIENFSPYPVERIEKKDMRSLTYLLTHLLTY